MDTTASTEVPAAGGPPASELTSTSTTGRFSCLENVANFRDVGENYNDDCKRGGDTRSPILRTKNLYRSARLDSASTTDVRTLVEEYGVKTVIDLRSDLERKECDHVASTFLVAAIEEEMKEELAPLTPSSNSECFQAEALQRAFPDNATSVAKRQRYSIEFAGSNFRRNSVWNPLHWTTKLKVIGLLALGQKPAAVHIIGRDYISPKGLEGLYKDFVDFCGTEIVTALKLMAQPSNYPLLVHCTQGKDRTGLVIAMALSCAEVPLEQIICDFARSNEGLDSQREIMILEMAKGGLHPSFVDAPADTLRSTFAYIQGKYGSVSDYLSQNGFGKDWQQQLRKCLVQE